MNRYQISKARKIAAFVTACAAKTKRATTAHELCKLVALMDADQWRTLAFQAGVAVADLDCKAATLAILRKRAPRLIGKGRAA
jgi:hypothetical protein